MLLLEVASWLLLLDFVSGQIPTPPSIPSIPAVATINENNGLAIASSATVAANSIASAATQNIVPSATSQALADASSATVKANSIASSATVKANSIASSATVSADSIAATAGKTDAPAATGSPTAALASSGSTSASSSSGSLAAAAATESSASSAAASKALSSSSKVGIGLGVPLGAAVAFAVAGLLIYRHRKYKRESRLGHTGNIKGGAYDPGSDEENRETTIGAWDERTSDSLQGFRTGDVSPQGTVSHGTSSQGVSPQSATKPRGTGWGDRGIVVPGVPEVHGEHVPPFTTELKGSSGVWKAELPS